MAYHSILVALDQIPGFQVLRRNFSREQDQEKKSGYLKQMAELYRQHVIGYHSKKEGGQNGQEAFFHEVGRVGSLMTHPRSFLARPGRPAAILRFALPELIDLRNPNALDPLEVERDYWNDPDNARYHIFEALDTIPGFKEARMGFTEAPDGEEKSAYLKQIAGLYRRYVIGYRSPIDRAKGGQLAFFYKVGGLQSLMTHPRTFFAKTGSAAAILRFALPELIDLRNPVALDPREVEKGYWTDPDNARYHINMALNTIPGFKEAHLGFMEAQEKVTKDGFLRQMADLYRQYVIGYQSKKANGPNGQTSFFMEVGGLGALVTYARDFLKEKHGPAALTRFVIPELIDDNNPVALKSREVEYAVRTDKLVSPDMSEVPGGVDLGETKHRLSINKGAQKDGPLYQRLWQSINSSRKEDVVYWREHIEGLSPVAVQIAPAHDLLLFLNSGKIVQGHLN